MQFDVEGWFWFIFEKLREIFAFSNVVAWCCPYVYQYKFLCKGQKHVNVDLAKLSIKPQNFGSEVIKLADQIFTMDVQILIFCLSDIITTIKIEN